MAMTLRLDEDESDHLREMAEAESLSQHEVVRRALKERYERMNHESAVHASGTRVVTRYAELLDRLSK